MYYIATYTKLILSPTVDTGQIFSLTTVGTKCIYVVYMRVTVGRLFIYSVIDNFKTRTSDDSWKNQLYIDVRVHEN